MGDTNLSFGDESFCRGKLNLSAAGTNIIDEMGG